MTNVTAYVGIGQSRDTITSFVTINKTFTSYKYNATNKLYLAVIPVKSRIGSYFTMAFNAEGSYLEEDLSFQTAFWTKAIGIIVGCAMALIAAIGTWLYYQKYGFDSCRNGCKKNATAKTSQA